MASNDRKGPTDAEIAERAVSMLRHLFDVLEFQIRQSPQLAREVIAFGARPAPPAAKGRPAAQPKARPPEPDEPPTLIRQRKPPAPVPPIHDPPALDPFRVYEDGWEVLLRAQLEPLNAKKLADIIHGFSLDPKGRTAGRKAEVLREWIVVAVIEKTDGAL